MIRTSKLNLWSQETGDFSTETRLQRISHCFFFWRGHKDRTQCYLPVHRHINQSSGCWESTPSRPKSMPAPILFGTAEIVRDSERRSCTKHSSLCSKWGEAINSLTQGVSLLLALLTPASYQSLWRKLTAGKK